MTSKERAKLKSVASNTDAILQIGKNPIGEAFIKQVRDALRARELIKIRVLETCEMLPAEAAQAICDEIGCETVQVIGSRIVLFKRRSRDDKRPSLLDEQKPSKSDKTVNRSGENAPKRERYGQKNGQYKSKSRQAGKQGTERRAEKDRKKSGNFRRGV